MMLNSGEQLGPHGTLVVNSFVAVAPNLCVGFQACSWIHLSSFEFDNQRELIALLIVSSSGCRGS